MHKLAIGVLGITSAALIFLSTSVSAIGVDFLGGTSTHAPISVKIGDHYVKNPEWETKPFSDYPYFSVRIRWGGHEVEWLHDKIYLTDGPDGIEDFSISDGYNYLLFNAPERFGNVEARLGLGVIVAHPEGVIDGQYIGSLGSPSWRVAGLGGQAALGYRGHVWEGLSYIVEGKVTTAFVRADYPKNVEDEGVQIVEINVPSTGYHLLLGVGYDF